LELDILFPISQPILRIKLVFALCFFLAGIFGSRGVFGCGGWRGPCLRRLVRRVRVGLLPWSVSEGRRKRERGEEGKGEQVLDICLEVVLRICLA
jgi:hypothetical protein